MRITFPPELIRINGASPSRFEYLSIAPESGRELSRSQRVLFEAGSDAPPHRPQLAASAFPAVAGVVLFCEVPPPIQIGYSFSVAVLGMRVTAA